MLHRFDGRPRLSASLLGVVLLGFGCQSGESGAPTERLWISSIPKNPKASIAAFVTARSTGDKYLGAFFVGSALRGGHDVFEWKYEGDDAAQLTFLQDGKTSRIRFETCKPTPGFDYCLVLHGDPTRAERYQSRKRWTFKRPGRRRAAGWSPVSDALHELAEDDADLDALLRMSTDP